MPSNHMGNLVPLSHQKAAPLSPIVVPVLVRPEPVLSKASQVNPPPDLSNIHTHTPHRAAPQISLEWGGSREGGGADTPGLQKEPC